MTDNAIARSAYANGTDPIDWAVTVAQIQIETARTIAAARAVQPGAFPMHHGDCTPESTARRIVGELLDAGWTPPTLPGRCAHCGDDPAPGHTCSECGRYSS